MWRHCELITIHNVQYLCYTLSVDHTRVILQDTDGSPGSDYINANRISQEDDNNPAVLAGEDFLLMFLIPGRLLQS